MIRAAFINLWLGFGIAMLLMLWKGQPELLSAAGWILAHVNLLLVGWMVQLAMGVAYWIFPRLPNTRTERGRYRYAYSAGLLLNIGVWGYTFAVVAGMTGLQVLALALQMAAVIAYVYHIIPRIRTSLPT
jgi:hypothetical protein